MGLDSVELLTEIEKTFGISIPDDEAEQIRTVGDLYEVVWRRMGGGDSYKCKSQYLFYKIRTALHHNFDIPLKQITLTAVPETYFPKENRRTIYNYFADAADIQLPKLVLGNPWWQMLNVFGLLSIGGTLIAAFLLYFFKNAEGWLFFLPIAGIILTNLLSKLLETKRTLIPHTSFSEFINEIVQLNFAKFNAATGTNRKEMEAVMNKIIIDKAGVQPEEVHAGASITDDLGMD